MNQNQVAMKEFYPNNKTYRIAEYTAGLQNGSQKTYSNNGKLESELSFKNGKKTWCLALLF